MYAFLEVEPDSVTARLFTNKFLKEERVFHSKIIAGAADGTLIYFGPDGHIHVVHGTGPGPADMEEKVKSAVSMIANGVQTLVNLGASVA